MRAVASPHHSRSRGSTHRPVRKNMGEEGRLISFPFMCLCECVAFIHVFIHVLAPPPGPLVTMKKRPYVDL